MSRNDLAIDPTSLQRLLAALCLGLAAAAFGAAGWLYGLQPLAATLGNWHVASDYDEVPAKVVTRSGKARDGSTTTWLAARYEVGGKTYFAERLSVLDDDSLDEAYNSRVMRWLEAANRRNETKNVYVSPHHPEISVVSNNFPLPSVLARIPLALGFTLLALGAAIGTVGVMLDAAYYRRLRRNWRIWAVLVTLCALVFPIALRVGTDADSSEFAEDTVPVAAWILLMALFVIPRQMFSSEDSETVADVKPKRAQKSK